MQPPDLSGELGRVGGQVGVDRTPPFGECRQLVGGGVDLAAAVTEPARTLVDHIGGLLGRRQVVAPERRELGPEVGRFLLQCGVEVR